MSNRQSSSRLRLSPVARGVVLATGLGGGTVGFFGSAAAQQLEEIVVTAERREMSLQDTPISVVAFSGDTLEFKGVRDLFEVANLTPNLDVKGGRTTGNTTLAYQIRGISGGGSVGVYIDNMFMPRNTGPVMRIMDLERMEVLRGPQGTLFGRNSTAGALRIFTKEPGSERDGYIRVTGGNFDRQDIIGMVNVPLGDNFAVRAQAASMEQDGFIRRGPQMLGDNEDVIGRIRAAWLPNDNLKVVFGAMYNKAENSGSPTIMKTFNMQPACPPALGGTGSTDEPVCWQGNYADWMSDFLEQHGQERLRHDDPRLLLGDRERNSWCFLDDANPDWDDLCRQWSKNDYTQFDVNLSWDLSDRITMVSVTGVSDFFADNVVDSPMMGMDHGRGQQESQTIWQETLFNIELFDGKLSLVTGGNYFYEELVSPRAVSIAVVGSSTYNATTGGAANGNEWGCAVGGAIRPFCASGERRTRRTGDSYSQSEISSLGAFISGTWHMTDSLNLTLGTRYVYETRDVENTFYPSDNFIPENGVSESRQGSNSWDEVDWRATLDYNATDDMMLYFTYSKAFRAGTYGPIGAGQNPTPERPWNILAPFGVIPPERLFNLEGGIRSEWFDSRLRINATIFDMNMTDRQGATAVLDPTSVTGFNIQTLSQGDVDFQGIELETSLVVTRNLTLDLGMGLIDYDMEDPCINNGMFVIPSPIERSWNLGGRYAVQMRRGGGLSFGLNYSYVGPQETHPGGLTAEQIQQLGCPNTAPMNFLDSRYRLDDYGLLQGTVRYTSDDGKWSATLFAQNLTDEVFANNAAAFGRGFWTAGGALAGLNNVNRNAISEFRGRPREFGVTFQYNFF